MRIVCWNVNGLRTLRRHNQWALPTFEAFLERLGGDLICIQEAKLTWRQLERDMCELASFEAFYDLNPTKGYAGVATFARRDICMPASASRGITGLLEDAGLPYSDLPLDAEGRAVSLDCGLFVLVNVYAPNETDSSRTEFRSVATDQNRLLRSLSLIHISEPTRPY